MIVGNSDECTYLPGTVKIKVTSAIVIKNKNGNDYLSLGYYDQDDYHIQRGIRINGDSLTQYCSENARSASAWFESSKAIMAESFATGSDHQVVKRAQRGKTERT